MARWRTLDTVMAKDGIFEWIFLTDELLGCAAFRSGAVMGFALSGIGLLVLFILLEIYRAVRSQL